MDAPVVVNPDMISKNASVNEGIEPLNQNGKSPNNVKIIHVKVTITDPSRFPIVEGGFRPKNNAEAPKTKQIMAVMKK
jgi:hypothetical protein